MKERIKLLWPARKIIKNRLNNSCLQKPPSLQGEECARLEAKHYLPTGGADSPPPGGWPD